MENTNAFIIIAVDGSFKLSSRLDTEEELMKNIFMIPNVISLELEKKYLIKNLSCQNFITNYFVIDLERTMITSKKEILVSEIEYSSVFMKILNNFRKMIRNFNRFGISLIGELTICCHHKSKAIVFDACSYDGNGNRLYGMLEMIYNNLMSTIT